MTFPCTSVIEMIVLLKVLWMWAWPTATFLRSRRRVRTTFFFLDNGVALLPLLAANAYRPLRTPPAAAVGPGPLAAGRQAPAVAEASVGPDLDQALDVHVHLAPEVTLDQDVLAAGEAVDDLADPGHLLVGQLADPGVGIDVGHPDHLLGRGAADAPDVGERDHHPLVAGDVDTGNTSQTPTPLALSLL